MNKLKLGCRTYFGTGEWDAFFGLFGDVFSKIAAVFGVLYFGAGFPLDIILHKILPGLAMGSIIGSIIYFWEAYSLNKKEGRTDVTALPFGISSTQVFAWMALIMIPVFKQTNDAQTAWQVALASCFIGGIIEVLGAFVSKWLKRYIPDSALLGNMAASALVWLALNGFVTAFQIPVISVIPLFLVFIGYKAGKQLIPKIPTTFLALIVGAVLAWCIGVCSPEGVKESVSYVGIYLPPVCMADIMQGLGKITPYLPIIIPLQIANFIATMQSVESAAIVNDNYPLKKSMIWDGATTMISAFFGSPFPTSVYYGHPGWKKAGARSGYSLMMCVPYIGCMLGLPLVILEIIPYEVIAVLLAFVGVTVTTETVDSLEKEKSAVIFISLFPILAQYVMNMLTDIFTDMQVTLSEVTAKAGESSAAVLTALQDLSYGAFASSLLYAAWIAYIYDQKFKAAGMSALVGAALSAIGFIHAPELSILPKKGVQFGICYLIVALVCFWIEKRRKNHGDTTGGI